LFVRHRHYYYLFDYYYYFLKNNVLSLFYKLTAKAEYSLEFRVRDDNKMPLLSPPPPPPPDESDFRFFVHSVSCDAVLQRCVCVLDGAPPSRLRSRRSVGALYFSFAFASAR
jgi:hypothetical protein